MLVLSRRTGESVVLTVNGVRVVVTVVDIRGDRVVVGFTAPAEAKILRAELERHED